MGEPAPLRLPREALLSRSWVRKFHPNPVQCKQVAPARAVWNGNAHPGFTGQPNAITGCALLASLRGYSRPPVS